MSGALGLCVGKSGPGIMQLVWLLMLFLVICVGLHNAHDCCQPGWSEFTVCLCASLFLSSHPPSRLTSFTLSDFVATSCVLFKMPTFDRQQQCSQYFVFLYQMIQDSFVALEKINLKI